MKNDENKKNVTEQGNETEQENVNNNQEQGNETKKEGWLKKAAKKAGKAIKKAWNFEVTLSPRKIVVATAGVAAAIFVGKRIYEAGQADAQAMLDYSEDDYEALPGEVSDTDSEVYDDTEVYDVNDYEEEVVEE